MMLLPYKIFAVLALIGGIFGGYLEWHHHIFKLGDSQGYTRAKDEFKLAYAKQSIINQAKEASDKKHSEEAYDEYLKTKTALDVANGKLVDADVSLRNSIAAYKRRLSETSKSTERTFDPREIGSDLLGECAERYTNLAKETGRLSDKANALIDQLNAIE